VILAVGEAVDRDFCKASGLSITEHGTLEYNRYTMETSREKFYAGGDLISGASNVSNAMGYGKKAARFIDQRLMEEVRAQEFLPHFDYDQAQPEHVDRLVLSAFTYKGNGAAEIERRQKHIAELRANPRRKRDANMIRSIFTRDGHPGIYDPAVPEAIIAAEMKFGDTIPSGTYLDMAANLPVVDPAKVMCPVLMTRGEWDGNSTNDDLLDFFRQLPNGDRQFVILPQTAHSAGFSKNRDLLWYAMKNFLAAPVPVAS